MNAKLAVTRIKTKRREALTNATRTKYLLRRERMLGRADGLRQALTIIAKKQVLEGQ